MGFHDNETNRFGSAGFATEQDLRRAGMFTQQSHSLLTGFMGTRPIWYSGDGGLLLVAGAREWPNQTASCRSVFSEKRTKT